MTVALPVMNHRFRPPSNFQAVSSTYTILPMRFLKLDEDRYIVTNFAGEYRVLSTRTLRAYVRHELTIDDPPYAELKAAHFLIDDDSTVALDLLATKYRTKQSLLSNFTSLFIYVVTLRCDHTCSYCQVSRQTQDKHAFDMSTETADRAMDFMFNSPSPQIKVEFQGGESLLNFDLIRHIVLGTKARNQSPGREIEFVIATNLSPLCDDHLAFCREHSIRISTSLDGPAALHNLHRTVPGLDSHSRTIAGIRRVRESLGQDMVAALMTTTEVSLSQPEAIIDEYVAQGFNTIFLRSISPYGFARRSRHDGRYDIDAWLDFYRRVLTYIIELNRQGTQFQEEYSALMLRRILTPFPTAYVDLQSPSGIGIAALVFNYDGRIYASDEGRMLAEMDDRTFCLGQLDTNSFAEVMTSRALLEPLAESMAETAPMCADCGVLPFCGSDPVFHHAVHGDFVGHKARSAFCRKNMEVIRHLVRLLEDDPVAAQILTRWAW